MSVRKVLRYPSPVLKRVADRVLAFDALLEKDIKDLIDTMYASPATVGLAAPQIGIGKRIFVCDLSSKIEGTGLEIFVNPVIVDCSGSRAFREGCLSLPDYTGTVGRYETITIRASDQTGSTFTKTASGFEAICWQHEVDHLDGMLFIHRVNNIHTDVFRRKRYQ